MIKIAEQKKEDLKINNVEFYVDDITHFEFQKSDMIIAYYTIQFVRPSQRQILINKIFEALNWGGGFLLFEKVRANDARFQDMMTSIYYDYKLEKGYTPDEIIAKSRSLKGVLEPFSTQGNIDLLKRAEFIDILTVFKYVCFEGFLAIK
jgi:tRNA (cmo5U34)-methyltransferase